MNNERLSVLLGTCLIPMIAVELKFPNENAVEFLDKFYRSSVYNTLIREDTAVWRLSAATLARLYLDELTTGTVDWPEEQ